MVLAVIVVAVVLHWANDGSGGAAQSAGGARGGDAASTAAGARRGDAVTDRKAVGDTSGQRGGATRDGKKEAKDGSATQGQQPRGDATSTPARPAAPARPVRVELWGDSLSWEARGPFTASVAAHGHANVRVRVYGGTALCDWLPDIQSQLASFRPQVVVFQFSGNNLTPCVETASGRKREGRALANAYRAAVHRVMGMIPSGVAVYWVAPPPMPSGRGAASALALTRVYRGLPDRYPRARFVDAGAAVSDGGRFTRRLPCLAGEPCPPGGPGTPVSVRAPDGVHFCPVETSGRRAGPGGCPVYSFGAHRYGRAMAAPVVRDFGL